MLDLDFMHEFFLLFSIFLLVELIVFCTYKYRLLWKGTTKWKAMPPKDWFLDLMILLCSFGNRLSTNTPKLAWRVINRYKYFLMWLSVFDCKLNCSSFFVFSSQHYSCFPSLSFAPESYWLRDVGNLFLASKMLYLYFFLSTHKNIHRFY